MDRGNTAVFMKASPVLPPRQESDLREGIVHRWMKIGFERYFLYKMKHGLSNWP